MSFVDFARAHGVEIDPNKLYPSDFIKRTGTVAKPKSGNGAYLWDGQRGWVMDWSGEAKAVWYEDPHAKPWTDEQKRQWFDKKRVQQSDKQKQYDIVAQRAEDILKISKVENHSYLEYKGFKNEKGFVNGKSLLIPMRNVRTNKLQGYQEIYFDPENRKYIKKMLYGMRAKNAVYWIGSNKDDDIWLVEGYATGLSVHQAMRSCGMKGSVVVCFSASNLLAVSDQIQGNKYVFADNDESGTGQEIASSTELPWTMADEVGWDANDLHQNKGIISVVKKIMLCKAKHLTTLINNKV
jgi:phage/plasmid primase-like uncharacterized protein